MSEKIHQVKLDDEFQRQLNVIIGRYGLARTSAGIRFCIAQTYKKEFPAYVSTNASLSIAERVKERERAKREVKNETKVALLEEKKALCNAMNGFLIPAGDSFMCRWKTYAKMADGILVGELTDPIENVKQQDVEKQYQNATKEEIHDIIKHKKMPVHVL